VAISSLVGHGVYVVTRARSLDGTGGAAAFGEVLMVGTWVAVAILQLLAGLQLRRGDPTAERTLKAYVIASIVGEALMLGLPFLVGFAFRGDRVEWFFAIRVVTAIDGVALPLVLWAFVRHHRVPMQEPRVPTTPAWGALVLVPYLAARPLVIDEALTPQFSAELAIVVAAGFGVQAVATALATRASLQDKLSAGRHALVATVVALVVTTMVIVLQQIDSDRHRLTTGPLISLVVTTAVMAWLPMW
jgi:hypothetical protein